MNRITCIIPFVACLVHAQGQPPTNAGHPRPLPPIFRVLDANQDGVIDAAELANASAALKKLDKNGDGRLTPDEYRPPRPDGPGPQANAPDPGGQSKSQDPGHKPPRPLLDLVLDVNGDEIIDASEIANAPALLKKLDVNGDGKLTREECLPKPPNGPSETKGPNPQSGNQPADGPTFP